MVVSFLSSNRASKGLGSSPKGLQRSRKYETKIFYKAILEKFDFDVYRIKLVHRDSWFMIFIVSAKNEALIGLLGITLPYNQPIDYLFLS